MKLNFLHNYTIHYLLFLIHSKFVVNHANPVYKKINRRVEHLTNLKLNSTDGSAENFYVST